jgi:hypothetical protein
MSIWTDLLMFHGHVVDRCTLALLTGARRAANTATAVAPEAQPEPGAVPETETACVVHHPPHALRSVCQLR